MVDRVDHLLPPIIAVSSKQLAVRRSAYCLLLTADCLLTLARPQPAQHKAHRMLGDIIDAAADDTGKIAERMWAEHFQAQRCQHRRIAFADRTLALALGNHLAQHGMKRIIELLVE